MALTAEEIMQRLMLGDIALKSQRREEQQADPTSASTTQAQRQFTLDQRGLELITSLLSAQSQQQQSLPSAQSQQQQPLPTPPVAETSQPLASRAKEVPMTNLDVAKGKIQFLSFLLGDVSDYMKMKITRPAYEKEYGKEEADALFSKKRGKSLSPAQPSSEAADSSTAVATSGEPIEKRATPETESTSPSPPVKRQRSNISSKPIQPPIQFDESRILRDLGSGEGDASNVES